MENKNFDQFIKQSLENLDGANHVPMDWSSLEGKIDADIDLNADVEADSFDQLIDQSLENIDGQDYAPMDWSLMENKLDAEFGTSTADTELDPQIEDIYLDAVAYDHLNNLESPYNKAHWEMMSARLDEEYAYRRKVIITKALEVLVVLLLVWTAINQPIKKLKNSSQPLPVATIPTSTDNSNNFNEATLPQSTNAENLLALNTPTAHAVDILKNKTKNNSEFSTEEDSNITSEESSSITSTSYNNIITPSSINITSLNQEEIVLVDSESREKISPITKLSPSNDLLIKENKEHTWTHSIIDGITPLESLTPKLLSIDNSEYDLLAGFEKNRNARKTALSFSMYSSADYNFIQSDFFNTSIKAWDVYQRDRYGYSGGFSIGFQLKRFLVETGASYSYISYNQREESNIIGSFKEGYLEEQWEDAELDMVQIPLNIQYAFLMKRKWRVYSVSGVSLNTAVKNNFNFQIEEQTASSRTPHSEIANEAASYKGLFEGGSLRNSSYLAANLGLGIERKFTYRWSLYLQPVYRHYFTFESLRLNGFGPQNDRIHSGSILFGAKVKIR